MLLQQHTVSIEGRAASAATGRVLVLLRQFVSIRERQSAGVEGEFQEGREGGRGSCAALPSDCVECCHRV